MAPHTRICLTGPESTGKTGLAQIVAAELRTAWVPEYSREYAETCGRELTAADVEPIARGQIESEERVTAAGVLVLDTDLISTVVYARHYYGEAPHWIEQEAFRRRADLYLLLDTDIPWLPDAIRDRGGDSREDLFDSFRSTLDEFETNWRIVSGRWDERVRLAVEWSRQKTSRWRRLRNVLKRRT